MKAPKKPVAFFLGLALFLSTVAVIGCGSGDEPVHGPGSIDIPEAALKKFSLPIPPEKTKKASGSRSSQAQ